MSRFVAAIDQGTTSTRVILFDKRGAVVAIEQKEHRQITPKPGWVEHNATEIWEITRQLLEKALAENGLTRQDIDSIGITNQRETVVIWDRLTGDPFYNAIVWQDTRTSDICNILSKQYGGDAFRNKTGLPVATYFSAPKLRWLIENVAEVRENVQQGNAMAGTIDTWLLWNLTGGINGGLHLTDVSNASRTMLMDLTTLDWDQELLEIFGIPRYILPAIKPSSMVRGQVRLDILEGVPVSGVLGDQQAALFGQTCFDPGEAKNTYGTGCFLLMNTGDKPVISEHGLLTTLGYQVEGKPPIYCLEGSIAYAGALVKWLRDNLGIIKSSSEIEALAQTVQDNGDVYIVPAFSGLFAPYWRNDARGVIVGLTSYANRGHLARATLEATAYQTYEVVSAMTKDSGIQIKQLKVDGGMVVNETLMQFQADLLNCPVVKPTVTETTALGAAYSAGLATGFWSGIDELRENWQKSKTWQPDTSDEIRAHLVSQWQKAVSKSFGWID